MKESLLKRIQREKDLNAFLKLLLLLIENGFSFQESLQIMHRNRQVSSVMLANFVQALNQGDSLMTCFETIGCHSKEVSQIHFSLIHGNFQRTLQTIVDQRKRVVLRKQELRKAVSYPLCLLGMLVLLILLIRQIILPDLLQSNFLDKSHLGIQFIQFFPIILLCFFSTLFIIRFIIIHYARKQSHLKMAKILSRLPFIGSLYSIYQTSYFTQEWGHLYQQGLENKQLLECMQQLPKQTLMYEMAKSMNAHFLQGRAFSTLISEYPFLTDELSVIIYQGEVTGRLGDELIVYSQLMLTQFTEKTSQLMKLIQPFLFILLAILIVSIYASLLKPLYTNLGGLGL